MLQAGLSALGSLRILWHSPHVRDHRWSSNLWIQPAEALDALAKQRQELAVMPKGGA
jgi:hypothetical protein